MRRLPAGAAAAILLAGCAHNRPAPMPAACGPGPYFDTLPSRFAVAPSTPGLVGLGPLGTLDPPQRTFPTDHAYLYYTREAAPIVSPGHAWLTSVVRAEFDETAEVPARYEYSIQPCSDISLRLGPVSNPPPLLLEAIGAFDPSSCVRTRRPGEPQRTECRKTTSIELASGDPLGDSGGGRALEFSLTDWHVSQPFANPSRYAPITLQAACPADYFNPAAAHQMMSHFGAPDGGEQRDAEPACGTFMQDEAPMAGNWFLAGSSDQANGLALAHDPIDRYGYKISVGTAAIRGLQPDVYAFTTEGPPGDVNVYFRAANQLGRVYCYEYLNGINRAGAVTGKVLLLEPVDGNTLLADLQDGEECGSGPWNFDVNVSTFIR